MTTTTTKTPTTKPIRIGVLSPAGRVVGHDRVQTSTYGDPVKALTSFTNIGDCFVYESSLRILDFAELVPIFAPEGEPSPAAIEAIDALDYVFLRGSNYINTTGEWDRVTALLRRTKVPVIAFGIGLQAPPDATTFVNDSTRDFLRLISERSAALGVRGQMSKDVLASIGITNTRIFGCPTAFRHRKPTVSIRRVASGEIGRLGFTLRRKTHGRATLQRYLMRTLAEQYPTTLFCAGELEEKAIYYANRGEVPEAGAVLDRATAALVKDNWVFGPADPILDLYRKSLAVFESVADFEAGLQDMDAVTGFRLHGNLLALAGGVPALYVTYDTRTREFVDTLGIPFVEAKAMDRWSFQAAWDKADFGRFERAYAARFKDLTAFLKENAMPHRLETEKVETPKVETQKALRAAA